MRSKRTHGVLAVFLTLAAGGWAIAAEDDRVAEGPITIVGSPTLIPVGTPCVVDLVPEREGKTIVEDRLEGTVVEALETGIRLDVDSERRTVTNHPALGAIPYLNRLTRSIGIAAPRPAEERTAWIASASIRSIRCLGASNDPAPREGASISPPGLLEMTSEMTTFDDGKGTIGVDFDFAPIDREPVDPSRPD